MTSTMMRGAVSSFQFPVLPFSQFTFARSSLSVDPRSACDGNYQDHDETHASHGLSLTRNANRRDAVVEIAATRPLDIIEIGNIRRERYRGASETRIFIHRHL